MAPSGRQLVANTPMEEISTYFEWDLRNVTTPRDRERGTTRLCVILQHNPLHDMEAVFWIVVCFVVNRHVVQAEGEAIGPRSPIEEEIQKLVAASLMEKKEIRKNVFFDQNSFTVDLECLHLTMNTMAETLILLRDTITKGYRAAESDMDQANWFHLADEVNNDMQYDLAQISYVLAASDIKVHPLEPRRRSVPTGMKPINKRLCIH